MNPIANFIERRFTAPARRMKEMQFEELTPSGGHILFLGDSITEGGAWHEWFPHVAVINRGIGGDRTAGVLHRLDTALRGGPSQVLLLIGTNDLTLKVPQGQITANVSRIAERIRDGGSGAELVLQSVMPRHAKIASRIQELNETYRRISDDLDATYLDLWPALSDGHDSLRSDFTLDNLHLSGAGYRAWVSTLEPLLRDTRTTEGRTAR